MVKHEVSRFSCYCLVTASKGTKGSNFIFMPSKEKMRPHVYALSTVCICMKVGRLT